MGVFDYTAMLLGLALVTVSLGLGATRMRKRLVPAWSGAPARLADVILGLAALIVALQVVGIAGALSVGPALAACVAAGLAMAFGGRGRAIRERASRETSSFPWVAAAVVIALLVMFAWAGPIVGSLHRGMTNGDTVWYHMPVAARFAQDGSITGLGYFGGSYLTWFYPANCELVHAFGILLAGSRDVLSPVISLAWLALALLSAWCVGRPFRAGALCVAALAPLLGSPLIVEREAGMAHTDVAGIAFLLGAVALLVNAGPDLRRDRGAVLIAALAAGLAVGTKLTLLAPVATLSIGVVVMAGGWRHRAVGTWFACLAAAGSFWYVRNVIDAGNPLPWIKLGAGPIVLAPATADPGGAPRASVLDYAHNVPVWHHYFLPELNDAFGALWPLLFALAAAGVLLAFIRGSRVQRLVGLAAVAAAIAYVANPLSAAGPQGAPSTFESNLRYLAPAMALGLVLLPTALPLAARARWGLLALLSGMLVVTRYPTDLVRAPSIGAVAMVALAAALLAAVLLLAHHRRAGVVVATIAVAASAVLGWPMARDYLHDRYAGRTDAKLETLHMDAAYRWASGISGARIATTSILQYGLYGSDLSNRVRYLGIAGPYGAWSAPSSCQSWRRALDAGNFNFLVLAPTYEDASPPVPAAWARSANSHPILRDYPTTVFQLSGPLPANRCP